MGSHPFTTRIALGIWREVRTLIAALCYFVIKRGVGDMANWIVLPTKYVQHTQGKFCTDRENAAISVLKSYWLTNNCGLPFQTCCHRFHLTWWLAWC